VRCDVTDEASVARAVDEVVRTFGRLDGAFNDAGIGAGHRPLHETGTADFDRVLATRHLSLIARVWSQAGTAAQPPQCDFVVVRTTTM
jgi:NAD(P)-dependent dehydrogenase (short-subunit alcohol dehydrogenase family)